MSKYCMWTAATMSNAFNQENIVRTGITCKKIPLKKLLNSACLWTRVQLTVNKKTEIFFVTSADHQFT